jgi:CHAT domain-containing protein/Tfp pilus assembly protein PilF
VIVIIAAMQTTTYSREVWQSNQSNGDTTIARSQGEVRRLELGKPIERELKGGESHSYEIPIEAGHFLNAVVDQRGIDVVVQVIAPDGKQLFEVDSPNGAQGPEPVRLIAETTGRYVVNVRSLEKEAAAGRYEFRLIELRLANEDDRALKETDSLNSKAAQYYGSGKIDDALEAASHALTIEERILGPNDPAVALSLSNIGVFYLSKREYEKAEPLLERALVIYETLYGKVHTSVAETLYNLAILRANKGENENAEALYIRSLRIYESVLGPEAPNVGAVLINLADLYQRRADYAKAEPLLVRALKIREGAYGSEHSEIIAALNNLANLYSDQAEYGKAEPLYIRSLKINEKTFGSNDPEVADALNNLASLYYFKGDYRKAEPLYRRSTEIREKAFGPEHPAVARSLHNLAELYRREGDCAKAEPLLIRSLAISEKRLGPNSIQDAGSLGSIAGCYMARAEYAKAEPFLERSLGIYEKLLGPEHPQVASALNNLADLYGSTGAYAKAESLWLRSLAIREKALGSEHPDVVSSLTNLAILYQLENEPQKALEFRVRANKTRERDLTRNLVVGSEHQKQLYLSQSAEETNQTISLHLRSLPDNPAAARMALEVILQRKGRALDVMVNAIANLRQRASGEDTILFDHLLQARSHLSALTLQGPAGVGIEKHRAELRALEEQVEGLEGELSDRSAPFRTQSQTISLKTVQDLIPDGAALAEFALYMPFDGRANPARLQQSAPSYAVYLLWKHGEPQWVDLGEAKGIDSAADALRAALRDPGRIDVKMFGRILDEKVMRPVRKLLGETTRIFLSPDGALNLIPFAALVDEQNQYLVSRYSFTYLTSGRDLIRMKERVQSRRPPTVIADPDFGEAGKRRAEVLTSSNKETDKGFMSDLYFSRLAQTEQEAKELKSLFPLAQVLTKTAATEAALKHIDSPQMLHIATHGFFLDQHSSLQEETSGDQTRLVIRRREDESNKRGTGEAEFINPLLRSGLGLAGANIRSGGEGDDGILTALEVTGLDLWGTKLVVLSACDTGVGEVRNGDGVYGLRRALVLAGSESQMMSLWPVSDRGTRELMIDYYKRLKVGEGRSDALRQAQLKMLANPKRQHPFYWASFIQSGEWANLDGKR